MKKRTLVPTLAIFSVWALSAQCPAQDRMNVLLLVRNELGRYTRYEVGQEEFYDTTKDPHEWTNEIKNPEYNGLVKQMRAALPPDSKIAPALRSALPDKKARNERMKARGKGDD